MNGFQRISGVLRGEAVDRTPMMLHNFMPAAREAGLTMKQFRARPENMARAFVEAVEKYELDGILIDMDTALEAHALGAAADFPENEPARIVGPAGRGLAEILPKVDPKRFLTDERVQIQLEAIRLLRQQVGGEIFIRGNADQGGFSLAMLLYGMEDFLADLMDEERKEDILQLIGRCNEAHLALHQMVSAAGADATSFGDSSCGPDLISRRLYLEFAHPFHREMKKALDESGILCICHICGKLDNILADVAAVGFAGVEVDYKTDIAKACAVLKGQSVMFGPIDPSGVFFFAGPEEVRRKTEEVLTIFQGRGLVIGAGCALPANTPEANIRAFVAAVKEKGRF